MSLLVVAKQFEFFREFLYVIPPHPILNYRPIWNPLVISVFGQTKEMCQGKSYNHQTSSEGSTI